MLDYRLDEELAALRQTVREFAVEVVAPVIGDFYERNEFPYEIVGQMGKMGLFGLPFPEEYGGMGGDYFALCIALEELARVDSSVAITLEAGVSLGAMPVYRYGTEEQKREWLPRLCSGELLGAFGLTEPGGGSDAGATRTTARIDGDEWVLNGTKAFITNSGTDITGFVTVTAVTGEQANGRKEISAILVPAGTPGFAVSKKYSKVGWNASDTRELSFDDCRVPAANLIGERGRGYAQFLSILDEGRIAIAALSVGLAQGCVDESVRYAPDRAEPGHRLQDRRHGRAGVHRPTGLLPGGGEDAARRAVQAGGRDRQAVLLGDRRHERPGGDPGAWRVRVHERVPGGPDVAGLEDPGDRRGYVGGPANGDRPRTRPLNANPDVLCPRHTGDTPVRRRRVVVRRGKEATCGL
jgi:alkylation response protein AidB-like acyl-CoA dehydrogenase